MKRMDALNSFQVTSASYKPILLSSGNIIDLQTLVVLLCLSIKLYTMMTYNMDLKHFLPQFFQVREDSITALAAEVHRKADKKWVKQKLHSDEEYPDLCPV